MLLSVVIPFYHVEKYIGACLERICQLPVQECEILLVDDCGSDASAEIAAQYCAAYAHVRVIRREKNGGLSAARNTGFDHAQGEYVYYLDSDDIPQPDALLELARAAKEKALDVANARFVYFDDETGEETPGPQIAATDVTPGRALFAAQCRADLYEPMVWQCVYRRAFLLEHGLRMAEGLHFEDELFQAPALFAAGRAAAFEMCILRYRQRSGSIMGSFSKSSRWCANYLEVCRRLHALGMQGEGDEASRALARRVGQIALSVVKNIAAYGLPQPVAQEAMGFAQENKKELCGYALKSGDVLVAAQGLLMRVSIPLFASIYSRR